MCFFTKDQVVQMIKEKTDDNSWEFVFLSADLEAIGQAMDYGIAGSKALLFRKKGGSAGAWAALSKSASDYRSSKSKSMGFKDEDRKHPDDPQKKKKKK